ncbi:MAG: metallophosphoesterase [Bacteroidetes bacterium]|nr:metallophosphoesterase [Bacteroidota bacterium]
MKSPNTILIFKFWKTVAILFTLLGCEKDDLIIYNTAETDYSFFIAGHTYGKTNVDNIGVHPPFKEKFQLITNDESIEFGVLTGDIVSSSTNQNWDEIDQNILSLNMDVFFAPGNHDIENRTLFESRYGSTYKSFIFNTDLFIILDPNIDGWNISGDQLAFLKDELENNSSLVDNIFIFSHQLLWWQPNNKFKRVKPNSVEGRADNINFWTEIEPLLRKLPNHVHLFAGDLGAKKGREEFMYYKYGNLTFIASGMGEGKRDNFIIIDVKKDKSFDYRLIALNGDNIHKLGDLQDYVLK